MTDIKVGLDVWVVPSSLYKHKTEPYKDTVSKVGKKYFQLIGNTRAKYSLETMREVADTNYLSKVYLTLNEIEEQKEHQQLSMFLSRKFQTYGRLPFSLNQLREIKKIIEQ